MSMEKLTDDEIKRWKVADLKSYLQSRDFPVSGARKERLQELAINANELNLPVSEADDSKLSSVAFRTVSAGYVIPELGRIKTSEDLGQLPSCELADVFSYALTVCGWDPKRLKSYRTDRGYLLFSERHIHDVRLGLVSHDVNKAQLPSPLYLVKASCVPETSQTSTPYQVTALIDSKGPVANARCTCPAGNGTCKHVMALLFALSDWNLRHTDRNVVTGTDVKCVWDKPRQASRPQPVSEINFSKSSNKRPRCEPSHENYTPAKSQASELELGEKWRILLQGTTAVANQILDTDCQNNQAIPDLRDMRKEGDFDVSDFGQYVSEKLTTTFVHSLEVATRGQAENHEWTRQRVGRITASRFHQIVSYSKGQQNNYLVKAILGTESVPFNIHIQFGTENEPVARQMYRDTELLKHKNGMVIDSGLVVNPAYPFFGASPDGFVSCDCCGQGLLEIKCSSKFRDLTPYEVSAQPRYHMVRNENGEAVLKLTSTWYSQIQFQLAICNKNWCDFVLFTRRGIHCERIFANSEFLQPKVLKARQFFAKYLFHKL